MARPFVIIGTVMFFSVYLLTGVAVESLPFLSLLVTALAGIFMIIGVRFKGLRPIFLVFLALTLSVCSYTFRIYYDYLPAVSLADNKPVIISGRVIDTYTRYDKCYVTLDNLQTGNNEKTHHKISVSGDALKTAVIDDIVVLSADGIAADSAVTLFCFPAEDCIFLSAECDTLLSVTGSEKHSVRYLLNSFRSFISSTLTANLAAEYAGAVNAMLTGDKTNLQQETQLIFSYSGISHLFAVSGLHLSLWTGMIFFFSERLKGRLRVAGNTFALLFIIFFMALTGFTPSVVRSGIMMIIFIIGKVIKHKSDSLNSLFIALSVILTVSPFSASSLSLQLSFLATLGIISFAAPVSEPFMKLRKIIKPKALFSICHTVYTTSALSFIATIFTCPVCAVNFGFYSFIAPVTNLLCLPVSQFILPLSSLGIATSFCPAVSSVPFTLCSLIMKYVLSVAEKLSQFRYCIVNTRTDTMQIFLFCLLVLSVILVCIFHDRKKPLRMTAFALIICFVAVSVSVFAAEKKSVSICVPSVGNGSAAVCNINGNRIIIGCGGNRYSEHIFNYTLRSVSAGNFDLLLVPRATRTESRYLKTLLESNSFGSIIAAEGPFEKESEELLPLSSVRTSFANINIDEKTNLVYIDNDDFHGARLETDNFTCTFIFNPVSDFSAVPQSWQEGNLLVTRQNLPDGELSFETTIVSTDSARCYQDNTVYSTQQFSDIMYSHTSFSGARIYADKR